MVVTRLVAECPGVKILATSREPLLVPGERVVAVGSLPAEDAMALFVDRAMAEAPDFELDDRQRQAVSALCDRLDGLPLAIELAAARINVLSPEQIADRLDDSFRLLTRGRRTDLPRHQTLRGAVDWSYQLLSEPEGLLFNQLSVFRGGFTLDAAEEVGSGDGLESYEVLDVLSQLVDKSLVVVGDGPEGESRYRLLEVLRLYGAERLAEAGQAEDVRGRHASSFFTMAETAAPELASSTQVLWLDRP